MKKISLFYPIVLLISACSSIPESDSDISGQKWTEHQLSISAMEYWEIKGRAAIKNNSDSATVTLYWKQLNSDYELRFISNLGQGTYLLKGSDDEVAIQTPKNEIFTADNSEKLMQEMLGLNIDLDGLKYWVRGIPEPNVKYSQLLLDDKGRLLDMKQSGFTISILRYTKQKNVSLPEKLFIRGKNSQLRLVIQNWEI